MQSNSYFFIVHLLNGTSSNSGQWHNIFHFSVSIVLVMASTIEQEPKHRLSSSTLYTLFIVNILHSSRNQLDIIKCIGLGHIMRCSKKFIISILVHHFISPMLCSTLADTIAILISWNSVRLQMQILEL